MARSSLFLRRYVPFQYSPHRSRIDRFLTDVINVSFLWSEIIIDYLYIILYTMYIIFYYYLRYLLNLLFFLFYMILWKNIYINMYICIGEVALCTLMEFRKTSDHRHIITVVLFLSLSLFLSGRSKTFFLAMYRRHVRRRRFGDTWIS